mmetsp:Transcript_110566/g.237963  ORF Transcript_110566/g.237963 Transcript_110566/m.237963 type:complete len:215 (-) Transcript_110566:914-1558(-)
MSSLATTSAFSCFSLFARRISSHTLCCSRTCSTYCFAYSSTRSASALRISCWEPVSGSSVLSTSASSVFRPSKFSGLALESFWRTRSTLSVACCCRRTFCSSAFLMASSSARFLSSSAFLAMSSCIRACSSARRFSSSSLFFAVSMARFSSSIFFLAAFSFRDSSSSFRRSSSSRARFSSRFFWRASSCALAFISFSSLWASRMSFSSSSFLLM